MRLHYERRGHGEPLVLVHGLGGDWRVWEPVFARVAAHRDTIAIDLPGFGESAPLEREDPTPVALAQAVAELISELDLDRPHVAGNSLGGWVALELGVLRAVRSVTAISPAGLWSRPLGAKAFSARGVARALLPTMPVLLRSAHGRALALSATVAHPERVPPHAALAMVRTYARAPGFKAANAAMRAGRFVDASRLDIPVTVAWGERDRLVRRHELPARGVRVVVLRDCGHIPTWDDPDQVTRVLLEGSSS